MERQIRALKREANAGGDKAVLGSQIRQKTQEYSAFSRACKIRPKMERVRVVGYDPVTGSSIKFFRNVGVKVKNYDVEDLKTGEVFQFAEGTKLQDVIVFAGKGTGVPYRKAKIR